MVCGYPWSSGQGPAAKDSKVWDLTKRSPRKWLFGSVNETKVVGDDEKSYFKWFVDIHDHLGMVQQPEAPRFSAEPPASLFRYLLTRLATFIFNEVTFARFNTFSPPCRIKINSWILPLKLIMVEDSSCTLVSLPRLFQVRYLLVVLLIHWKSMSPF